MCPMFFASPAKPDSLPAKDMPMGRTKLFMLIEIRICISTITIPPKVPNMYHCIIESQGGFVRHEIYPEKTNSTHIQTSLRKSISAAVIALQEISAGGLRAL